ncbi:MULTISPECIES: polysaccharide biosynthesis protein [unclassified Pseudomonas]|jgi:FlaA1/EpsC-like NDP-sugar epimerase|uniref:polysaccharide biosynthesis protein n=1 Tax=unclassified Pseudomonas TaxID=196821 RepID=UPI0008B7EAA7|nr:polysaccharide biosynthesis protein [Pseudomonas sp. FW305-3-2-15-C-TSA2]PMV24111.1 polysaccharide biosynthesis protein [Pseudomonas sp. DP16D-L5]PMV37605.1 polysaccharide biosynthesis protein [Pseudomonas sp. FW305-3-2-15-A-LB2]PMV42097.1 polysaccharide biosynthesis protein [Pseudomonas sp. FW305-3-2-15-C-R2A1]PMV47945.1 polysaccharide biosynthesis protein [Pseudomonas sp. FW305-3-2-15-C-LB1]PMV52865.1 polysaccharide biosynthesis protein [Pseudomonas sp. GW460-4]PMV56481.1 polysaccharide 
MDKMRAFLLSLPRRQKRILQVAADILLVWFALWMAFLVRLGLDELVNPFTTHFWLFLTAPIVAIPLFIRFGMYRAVMRYFGNDALIAIIKAVSLSSLILGVVVYWYSNHQNVVPRSIIFNYWWLSLILVGGLRLAMRQYFLGDWFAAAQHVPFTSREDGLPRVAIYGAGAAGNQLVAALRMGRVMRPVAFIDDDSSISDRVISGLQVYKPKHIQRMIDVTGAQEILLAIPSSNRARRREILGFLEGFPLHVRSVPGFMDLASGRVKVDDIQEVDIADLLGRDAVPAQNELLEHCIKGKSVLVTGAGGSIGSELCRQILNSNPTTLLLFEHSEFNLYSILSELELRIARDSLPVRLLPILGSVRNEKKLIDVMRAWRVDTVYHAAAYKHVPMVEHNIAEGVLNNVMGTLNTAQAALQVGVANFVLISTDKAVRPTNVMGSTKRLAELTLQALSQEVAPVLFGEKSNVSRVNKTRFTMVRFGNVLGSSGSVIPLFYKQIKSGGPLTVTHPKITRYFMTIPEAAQLVIQAGSMGQGGDVFVLDMGEPVKIIELAEKMIHLSGLSVRSEKNPHGDISVEFSGLRPGEKLYEELLIGDNVVATPHPMIMSANEDYLSWESLKIKLAELLVAVDKDDYARVRQLLRETVSGYSPDGEIVDWIYQQRRFEP